MLRDVIAENRDEILAKARARVAARIGPLGLDTEGAAHGLPVFLDQLGEALRRSQLHEAVDHADITDSAGQHGDHLFHQGLTVAQVINSYGDLCQVVTGLVAARGMVIRAEEFQTLNLCLDDATAGAVTAYSRQRERAISDVGTERLGVLAHELRNALNAAMLSFASIKNGTVATRGSTSAMLDRSLIRLQTLIDSSLADVRLDAGLFSLQRIPVWEVFEEAEIGANLVAEAKGLLFEVSSPDHSLMVEADRPTLAAALANLLQNAFKFTRPGSTVKLRARERSARVLIDVEDQCGGIPTGVTKGLGRPFIQMGTNRTGLGLGLSISLKAVKMMAGEIHVRDLPGDGCVFTIDLPRLPLASPPFRDSASRPTPLPEP